MPERIMVGTNHSLTQQLNSLHEITPLGGGAKLGLKRSSIWETQNYELGAELSLLYELWL
jgi:hypothetical protein